MQVNSIQSTTAASFKGKVTRDDLVTLANLDDNKVKNLAYQKTLNDVNESKHRRIDKALFYSLPFLFGGIAAAAIPSKARVNFTKNSFAKNVPQKLINQFNTINVSRMGKIGEFARHSLGWIAAFGVIDGVFAGKRMLDKNSDSMNNFSQNHPILSLVATSAVSIGAIFGLKRLGSKLLAKTAPAKISKETAEAFVNLNKKLNNNKVLNNISKQTQKVPSALKSLGRNILEWSPLIVMTTWLAHSIGHDKAKTAQFVNNYNVLNTNREIARTILTQEATQED